MSKSLPRFDRDTTALYPDAWGFRYAKGADAHVAENEIPATDFDRPAPNDRSHLPPRPITIADSNARQSEFYRKWEKYGGGPATWPEHER